MKILLRLLRRSRGPCGWPASTLPAWPRPAVPARSAWSFQNPADQLFAATVEQDVAFGPRNLGLPEVEVAERVQEALRQSTPCR